ncbi:MAG TPA: hypothetical protein VFS43_30760 [Polyangiaceae bacterium]|nr:hypothetical protein [Polyangiaceae bacterium]
MRTSWLFLAPISLAAVLTAVSCGGDDDDDDGGSGGSSGRQGAGGGGQQGAGGGQQGAGGGAGMGGGGGGGAAGSGGGGLPLGPTYASLKANVFLTKGCNNCHSRIYEDYDKLTAALPTLGSPTGGADASCVANPDYSSVPIIEKGNAEASLMYIKVARPTEAQDCGERMPQAPEEPLTQAEIDAIKQWIDNGANDDLRAPPPAAASRPLGGRGLRRAGLAGARFRFRLVSSSRGRTTLLSRGHQPRSRPSRGPRRTTLRGERGRRQGRAPRPAHVRAGFRRGAAVKLPVSKSTAIAVGGVLLVTGLVIAAEQGGGRPKRERPRRDPAAEGSARPRRSAEPNTCPTENAVVDPELKVDPEFVKTRFVTKTCWRTAAGDLSSCSDADDAACEKRVGAMRRVIGKAGECVGRPAELFCAVHVAANGKPANTCFETKASCDAFLEKKRGRSHVCRIVPACERVALAPI